MYEVYGDGKLGSKRKTFRKAMEDCFTAIAIHGCSRISIMRGKKVVFDGTRYPEGENP